jgi:hypothetical protein
MAICLMGGNSALAGLYSFALKGEATPAADWPMVKAIAKLIMNDTIHLPAMTAILRRRS